jgi:hypothetical protein
MALLIVLGLSSTAMATTTQSTNSCPSGYTCVPANKTVVKYSKSSSSAHVTIVKEKTVKEDVEEFERVTHKVVGFNQNQNHSSTAGLTACHWGTADWSGWKLINGVPRYTKNAPHGRTHMCFSKKLKRWLQVGDCDEQLCCGNTVIPKGEAAPPEREQVKAIVSYRTTKQFMSTFNKWVMKSRRAHSTQSTKTVYSCSAGWTLSGTQCWSATPLPPTTVTPTPVCSDTNAINNGQNGACVYQSAQQTCETKNGSWDTSTQTCTVVVGNCSTIYVINGNGNVVGAPTQSGNCNTTVLPPAPTCASTNQFGSYPFCFTFSVTSITQNQEYDLNESGLTVCATLTGDTSAVTSVQFSSDHYGAFEDGGYVASSQTGNPDLWCDFTYAAGSDMPPNGLANITATASDASGDSSSFTGTVTYTNAPPFH